MADDTLTEEDRSAEPDVGTGTKGAGAVRTPDEFDAVPQEAARGMGGITDRGLADSFADIKAKQARIGELYQQRNQALAPRYDAMQRSLEAQDQDPALNVPQFKPQPQVPKQRQGEILQTVAPFVAAMAVMSRMGFGSHHLRETMAATLGMIKGVNEGSKEAVEENQKIWEMESRAVTEENREKLAAYQAAYQKYRGDFQRQMEAIKIEAAKFDDEIAYLTASQGDSVKLSEYMFKLQKLTENYESAHQRLLLQQERTKTEHEKFLRAQQGGAGKNATFNTSQGIADQAERYIQAFAPDHADDPRLRGLVEQWVQVNRGATGVPPSVAVDKVISDYLANQRKAGVDVRGQMEDKPGGFFGYGAKKAAGKTEDNPIVIHSNEELMAIPHGKGKIYYRWFDENEATNKATHWIE